MRATLEQASVTRSALDAGLDYLTIQERKLFDCLLPQLGAWVPVEAVQKRMYRFSDYSAAHATRVHLSRLRRKLKDHNAPWRIDGCPGALRLMLDAEL